MNFSVELTAWTYLLGGAVSWEAEYYDYGLDVIIPAGYHLMDERASFSNVSGGGYLAVRLYDGNTLTPWIYSTSFAPKDGEIWQFRLYYHGQQGDMVLVPIVVPGWVLVDKVTLTLIKVGEAVPGWVLVDKVTSTLIKGAGAVVAGWVLVDRTLATLNHKTVTPPPPEEGGVPWIPIAIGVGAAVAIAAAVAGSKKKAKGG